MHLLAVVTVVFNHGLQIGHVKFVQELLHRYFLLLELDEELLGVTPGLRARASANVLLHSFPLLAVFFEGLQKAVVLISRPTPGGLDG